MCDPSCQPWQLRLRTRMLSRQSKFRLLRFQFCIFAGSDISLPIGRSLTSSGDRLSNYCFLQYCPCPNDIAEHKKMHWA
jgi:hypothetical protein